MKVKFVLIFLVYLSLSALGQSNNKLPSPTVDKRVELLSIAFRLADSEEYSSTDNAKYAKAIKSHFDKYKKHPLIEYIRQIRDSKGIGYDAVMSMAIYLNHVPSLDPIIPFNSNVPDKRWDAETSNKFVTLLKQFYKDTDCNSFFISNSNRYLIAEKQFYELFKKLDIDWFYKYYGKSPSESFNVIIGLGNGGNNFGPSVELPDGSRKVYAIVGAGSFDRTGTPVFPIDIHLPTLVHEFNHSFINYLTEMYRLPLSHSGEIIYENQSVKMKRQKYGEWVTMISESMVRASVIRYLIGHASDTLTIDRELKQQLANGFVWMKELVDFLGQFEAQRTTYPTLESFMPKIVSFYDTIAPHIKVYDNAYLEKCAKVISTLPFGNGDTTVSPKTSKILFNFNKKLDGIRYFFGPEKDEKISYPEPISFTFSNDNKTIIMKVKLKPNTDYQINVYGSRMRTIDGYSVQNYPLNFRTSDK
jgi:hypothetical protein